MLRGSKTATYYFWSLLLSAAGSAEESWRGASGACSVQITAPSSAELFQQVSITLILDYPKNYQINPSELEEHLMTFSVLHTPPFRLLDVKKESKEEGGALSQTLQFFLQPERIGNFPIAFGAIHFVPQTAAAGAPITLLAKPLSLHVNPTGTPTPPALPIAPLLSYSPQWPLELTEENEALLAQEQSQQPQRILKRFAQSAIPWEGLAFFLLLAFLAIFGRCYLFIPEEMTQRQKAARARRLALAALEALPKRALPPKANYEATVNIIRKLLAEGYHLFPLGATTEECVDKLRACTALHEEIRKPVEQFLMRADLVKFATLLPSTAEVADAQKLAHTLIQGSLGKDFALPQTPSRD